MKTDFEIIWIKAIVCISFGVDVAEIDKKHPVRRVSEAKQVIQYILWLTGRTYRESGEAVGSCNPKSAEYAIKRIMKRYEKSKHTGNWFYRRLDGLKLILNAG